MGQRRVKCLCGKRGTKVWLPRGSRNAYWQPVVYHVNKAGEVVIPPGNDISPLPGYTVRTANTLPEVRQLTKVMSRQKQEEFYKYHGRRIDLKKENVQRNLEHAMRAREKMSVPQAQAMTDYAISRMKEQLRETLPDFKGTGGHFLAFE